MNYLLVKPEELDGQGYDYKYAERIPDGRVILPLSALKVLSNFNTEVLSKDKLKALIKEQKESCLYDPLEENAGNSEKPGDGGNLNGDEPSGEDTTTEESTPAEDPVEQEGGSV